MTLTFVFFFGGGLNSPHEILSQIAFPTRKLNLSSNHCGFWWMGCFSIRTVQKLHHKSSQPFFYAVAALVALEAFA